MHSLADYKISIMKRLHLNSNPFLFFALIVWLVSCQYKLTDAEVAKNIRKEISSMQGYEAVNVVVRNKIVFLTGQCPGHGCALQLQQKIKEMDGVLAVENDLTEGLPATK